MNKCVEPFWQTVDRMLDRGTNHDISRQDSSDATSPSSPSMLVYVNTCPSQDTFDEFAEYGLQYGFEEFNWPVV